MQLSELIKAIQPKRIIGNQQVEIFGLAYDSRRVRPKGLFVAIKGANYDGHNFVAQAVKLGVQAVVVEKEQKIPDGITQIVVADSRLALGKLAAHFYSYPGKQLNLVGVTGTNGKTTVTSLLASIFKESGARVGLIGTIAYFINEKRYQAEHTTPHSLDLQQILAEMVNQQVDYVSMEVSSHGLAHHRPVGCAFKAVVFTNLSHDHLDFHQTLEAYFAAKSRLFQSDEYQSKLKVINQDDVFGQRLLKHINGQTVTFGFKTGDFYVESVEAVNTDGIKLVIKGPNRLLLKIKSSLLGFFNIYNLLAAAATAASLGFSSRQIEAGIKALQFVPGRFMPVNCGQSFTVIVDYAHTPDGLKKVLESAHQLGPKRIITVFGCGGDRDKTKRPLMGEIAVNLSDYTIITSDNPRSEDPKQIIADIVMGIPAAKRRSSFTTVINREEAIALAIKMAQPNDLVLLAGKGHEDYQIIGNKVIPFDDCEVAQKIIKEVLAKNGTANISRNC